MEWSFFKIHVPACVPASSNYSIMAQIGATESIPHRPSSPRKKCKDSRRKQDRKNHPRFFIEEKKK
jgi:hypothetical protein